MLSDVECVVWNVAFRIIADVREVFGFAGFSEHDVRPEWRLGFAAGFFHGLTISLSRRTDMGGVGVGVSVHRSTPSEAKVKLSGST
jgi:hypothetical protein